MSSNSDQSSFDRRSFLRWSGAAISASWLGTRAWARPQTEAKDLPQHLDFRRPPEQVYDAVIIGGGLSGLTAASALNQLGNHRVKVLEVRDRVGGRTLNAATAGGGVVELGGQWVGPTQDAVLNLMASLNIDRFPTYNIGAPVNDTSETLNAVELLDYWQAIQRIDQMAQTVPLNNPWDAAQASQWDAMTVQDWMNANMATDAAKSLIDFTVQVDFGGPARRVSLLWFLFYVHSGTNFNTMSEKAQRWRVVGGTQVISLELANRLGQQVELNAEVEGILWDDRGALIHFGGGRLIGAKKVIVAMMPKDADRIRFFPNLPSDRANLQKLWSTGQGDKYFAVYNTPFWRQQGRNGIAYSDNQFIVLAWDNSPPSGSPGILGGFPILEGSNRPPTKALRRRLVLRSFADFFGPEAYNAIDYHEYSWGLDPLTEGCVTPLEPGLLTAFGPALRQPVGPIHWAGTESSTVWCGYLDGAVRAGERAAQEVHALLP